MKPSMTRQAVLLQSLVGLLLIGTAAGFLALTESQKAEGQSQAEAEARLRQTGSLIQARLREIRSDVDHLSRLSWVTDAAAEGPLTSYLQADPATFRLNPGPRESRIIELFAAYRGSHSEVASVYMGRSDGSFVRSHPRAQATAYDPRQRPWYIAALTAPDQVTVTEAYRAVTTEDINVGLVRPLRDAQGLIVGVLGMDVTLNSLSKALGAVERPPGAELLLLDDRDRVLAHSAGQGLFEVLDPARLKDLTANNILYQQGLEEVPWRLLQLLPRSYLEQRVWVSALELGGRAFLLLALLGLLNIAILSLMVIKPLRTLESAAVDMARLSDWNRRFPTKASSAEISHLALAFNRVLDALHRSRAERQAAEEANALKSAFLATMSHELRTPLNSIIGFTGILSQGLAGPLNGEQQHQLGLVKTSAQHLLALINDILDISKIEAGQLKLNPETLDLPPLLARLLDQVRPGAAARGLSLVAQWPETLPRLQADRRRLEQVLLNLLSNAVKFTEKGTVTLKAQPRGPHLELSVQDTGPGIAPADQERLFEPFVQLDQGLNRRYEGTGLGLSITRKLVELMNGRIELDSQVGMGSTFKILLPVP